MLVYFIYFPHFIYSISEDRTAAVVAALESQSDVVPMSSRRYTGGAQMQTVSVSPSPSFEMGSHDSGGSNTPSHIVSV